MKSISQSPRDDGFVQNPYPFYDRLRGMGPLVYWEEYAMAVAPGYETVSALLRDKRFGRENPYPAKVEDHVSTFFGVEQHSMLELEPPRHTRLRGLVLRAFTTRRIASLAPQIERLCHELIDTFPEGPFDLLTHYAQQVPVILIARLLGVPEEMAPQLLTWSHAMVGMYQADRSRDMEQAADDATRMFSDFLRGYIAERRDTPRDDLITELIAAEADGAKLSTEEMISTCILLLNAGHEATVHTIGNALKTCLEQRIRPDRNPAFIEEVLRHDPPLHLFVRYALQDVEIYGQNIRKGTQIGLLLAAANRDPSVYTDPDQFIPDRKAKPHASFGGGIHFCLGAPLARLELSHALPILFKRCPDLALAETPRYAPIYHFHGLGQLMVTR